MGGIWKINKGVSFTIFIKIVVWNHSIWYQSTVLALCQLQIN